MTEIPDRLRYLVESYLESRRNAVNFPSMAQMANNNAEIIYRTALHEGFTPTQWEEATKQLYDPNK